MADSSSTPARHTARWYAPHHFVLIPLALLTFGYAVRRYADVAGTDSDSSRLWFTVMLLGLLTLGTLVMMRQHYALGLQDRLIRLEVRQRYFELTSRSFRTLEPRLTMKQITVLRFAPDEQLPTLAEAAASQSLTPKAIIEQIGAGYQPDLLRL